MPRRAVKRFSGRSHGSVDVARRTAWYQGPGLTAVGVVGFERAAVASQGAMTGNGICVTDDRLLHGACLWRLLSHGAWRMARLRGAIAVAGYRASPRGCKGTLAAPARP